MIQFNYAFIRISQAHAKLMFHEEVEVVDAVMAVALVESSMQDSNVLELNYDNHTPFPDDPTEAYRELVTNILTKLNLLEILNLENTH